MKDLELTKLHKFKKISLDELNTTASYLKRIDRKFLLTQSQFKNILRKLGSDFKILEIDKKRIFSYDNIYMDTKNYLLYNQHQNKEKSRTKIRTRLYKDLNMAFFEYKQKDDGITKKFRYKFPVMEHGNMCKGKKRFFQGIWQAMYDGKKAPEIFPSIQTKYKRITLVHKKGYERLTVDFDIKINNLRNKNSKDIDLKNLVIVESKSLNQKCVTCKIIEKHGIKQAKSCSKYSLGVIYSGATKNFDTFKDTVDKIKEIRKKGVKSKFIKSFY